MRISDWSSDVCSSDLLIPVLENVRDSEHGPVLIHAVTMKGKGYAPAEAAADKYHGVQKFDVITGEQAKAPPGPPAYQNVFGETLAKLADTDQHIVAITPAMPARSEERRAGNECVRTWRSRGA